MPTLTKSASGLLLFEDFSVNNLLWTLSPNNYNNIEYLNGLHMKHNADHTTYSIIEPDKKYIFVCELDHIPVNKSDIGGVIVLSDNVNYVECQSYIADGPSSVTNESRTEDMIKGYVNDVLDNYVEYRVVEEGMVIEDPIVDPGTGETETPVTTTPFVDIMYPYIKIERYLGVYTFFASNDGRTWIEVGNASLPDANRIGFFVYGSDDPEIISNSHFFVKQAVFYNNNYIVFNNIKPEQQFELVQNGAVICDDTSKFAIRKNNQVIIDTTTLLIPLKNTIFNVIQDGDVIFSYVIPELVGGDIYDYGYDIKVSINAVEINQEELYDLGTFYSNDQTIRIDIQNNEEYALQNLNVTIIAYSVYYGGEETMSVSLYDESQVNYNFQKSVVIPTINPTEGKSVLLKLTNKMIQDFYKAAGSYRFKINIE